MILVEIRGHDFGLEKKKQLFKAANERKGEKLTASRLSQHDKDKHLLLYITWIECQHDIGNIFVHNLNRGL